MDPKDLIKISQVENYVSNKMAEHDEQWQPSFGLYLFGVHQLTFLKHGTPPGVVELGEYLVKTQQAVGKQLRLLAAIGYLDVEVNPDDKRARRITLTDTGHDLLSKYITALREAV